jgi:hypothetical protein
LFTAEARLAGDFGSRRTFAQKLPTGSEAARILSVAYRGEVTSWRREGDSQVETVSGKAARPCGGRGYFNFLTKTEGFLAALGMTD